MSNAIHEEENEKKAELYCCILSHVYSRTLEQTTRQMTISKNGKMGIKAIAK